MKLEKIKLSEITPYKNNAKVHDEFQIGQIRDSIIEYGYNDPIAVDEKNEIIEGHGRCEALKQIFAGEPDKQIEIVRLIGLTEKQKKKYRIAHNKINQNTGFDFDLLKKDFESIGESEFFKEVGFSSSEMKLLDPIDIPEETVEVNSYERAKAKTHIKLGEMFKLGEHYLLCGDSTNEMQVKRLMGENKPVLMVTDPPYGVNYDPKWRDEADKKGILKNNYPTRATGEVENDDRIDWADAYKLFPGAVAYVWHADKHMKEVQISLENCGFEVINQIVWVKPHFALSRGDYHFKHEPCLYVVKKGEKHNWQGSRNENTVWEIAGMNAMGSSHKPEDERTGHGTQKPIECMIRPILNNSKEGDFIYDPFGGSGSTMIAAQNSKRKCLMCEIDPTYCQIIIDRFEKLTGIKVESV